QAPRRLLLLRCFTLWARQTRLPRLLSDGGLDAANNSGTHRSTHSRASHNSATLRPLAKSPREPVAGLLARLLRLLLDITEVLLDFLAQPRRAGQDRNIGCGQLSTRRHNAPPSLHRLHTRRQVSVNFRTGRLLNG